MKATLQSVRSALEPLIRNVLHAYWRFARGLTLGARALVVDDQRRVFLVQHSYVRGWHLPGGGVEPGETLLDALIRELREEANIEPTAPPRLHGIFFNERVSRRDHVAVFVRDRGVGFDRAAVPADRRGVAESIEGRMRRAGGAAAVTSSPGEGTEVELTLPRAAA